MLAHNVKAAQKRVHAQNQLLDIDGLNHVIIHARLKAAAFILNAVPGGNKQDGEGITRRAEAFQKRKNLDMQVELSPIRYRASRELLSHVWRNLLDNAIKYSDPGGVITVAASQTPGGVEVTIADCGAGMDSETAANMFERYYRGNSAAVGGHGLGAAIAASIVRLMNGSIEVKSELGVGTSVTVRLPGKETA